MKLAPLGLNWLEVQGWGRDTVQSLPPVSLRTMSWLLYPESSAMKLPRYTPPAPLKTP